MDRVDSQKRSEIMSKVQQKDTAPEMVVRCLVHSLGYRYRLHSKQLPGKPDLVFSGRKKVIFVHGCFWHGHDGCTKGRPPKSRQEYWLPKLKANKERDARVVEELKTLGWRCLVVWQCEVKNLEMLKMNIIEFLES